MMENDETLSQEVAEETESTEKTDSLEENEPVSNDVSDETESSVEEPSEENTEPTEEAEVSQTDNDDSESDESEKTEDSAENQQDESDNDLPEEKGSILKAVLIRFIAAIVIVAVVFGGMTAFDRFYLQRDKTFTQKNYSIDMPASMQIVDSESKSPSFVQAYGNKDIELLVEKLTDDQIKYAEFNDKTTTKDIFDFYNSLEKDIKYESCKDDYITVETVNNGHNLYGVQRFYWTGDTFMCFTFFCEDTVSDKYDAKFRDWLSSVKII